MLRRSHLVPGEAARDHRQHFVWNKVMIKIIMVIIIIIMALINLTFWDESTFVRVQLGKLLPAQRIPWSRQKNTSKMTMETKKMVMETKNMMMWKMSTMKRVEDLIFCSASPPPWRAFQSSANSDWSIPLFPSLSACHNDDDDDDDEEEEEEDCNWSIPLFPPLSACHGFYHLHIYSDQFSRSQVEGTKWSNNPQSLVRKVTRTGNPHNIYDDDSWVIPLSPSLSICHVMLGRRRISHSSSPMPGNTNVFLFKIIVSIVLPALSFPPWQHVCDMVSANSETSSYEWVYFVSFWENVFTPI